MANALQLRRGTTTQHSTFTGLAGEVTVDTTKDTVVVHDGATAGGIPLATESYVGTEVASLVDSAPSTLDTLNELAAALGDDANFSTTVTNSIATKMPLAGGTFTGNVTFNDSVKAVFGTGSDLQIYHNGGGSFIDDTGTGNLHMRASDAVWIQNATGTATYIYAANANKVRLYHNNVAKLDTTSTGVEVFGDIDVSGELANSTNRLTNMWFSGAIDGGDDAIIRLGNGDDLKLIHDGSNSRIETSSSSSGDLYLKSQGAGHDLYLQAADDIYIRPQDGENGIKVIGDGAVELYHNNSLKGYTDTSGFSVSGRLNIDGSNVTNTFVGGTVFQGTGSGWNLRAHTSSSTSTAQVFGVLQHSESETASPGGNILSCLNNGNVGIGVQVPSKRLHVNGNARIDGTLDIEEVFEKVTTTTATGGTFSFYALNQGVLYFTANQSQNSVVNFVGDASNSLNSILDVGQSVTCTIPMTQGSTAYYMSGVQVDNSAVTPKWSGGSAPTEGNASGIDVYTFTIIKTANATFTVLASVTQYA